MNVKITPNILEGDVLIPPSKSLSHRAIIAASLAEGKSIIENVLLSNDIVATIEGMRSLGADIEIVDNNKLIIKGSKVKRVNNIINCKESGSTVRFLIPISLLSDEEITFTGENHLVNRPLDLYTEIFDKQNIFYKKQDKELPLTIKGKLKADKFYIRGDVSSQFITGLLYTLPLLEDDSEIVITTNLESKGYIDLTLDILKLFNINIINNNYESFIIKGNQKFISNNYTIEGDYSQAAFWLVAGALNGNLKLHNLRKDTFQGDKEILDFLKIMNVDVRYDNNIVIPIKSKSIGNTIDLSQSPDLGPIITVLASVSEGETRIINAERLRIKESDRIKAILTELNKMGANIIETKDGMIINGVKNLKGNVTLDSWNDHRIAMALTIASIKTEGSYIIKNASCVSKSYPHFFEDFKKVKGVVSCE